MGFCCIKISILERNGKELIEKYSAKLSTMICYGGARARCARIRPSALDDLTTAFDGRILVR